MPQTTTAPNGSARAALEEPLLVRYSPHHELPLSSATSLGLHAVVIALLLLGGFVIARLNWGGDRGPVEVGVLALDEPRVGGDGKPIGDGRGAGPGGDPNAAPVPDPQPGQPAEGDAPARERLKEVREAALKLPEAQDKDTQRLIEQGGDTVDRLLALSQGTRDRLKGQLAGKGPGGPGRGPGQGPGLGNADERIRRMMGWTLIFNTRDGKDYLRQLQAAGAILGIPDPKDPDGYLVIRDLGQHPAQPRAEDVAQIQRIYWHDNQPASVRSLASALGIPAPPGFVVFFPVEFEEKLLHLELSYRGKKESEIIETRFVMRLVRGTYEPVVLSQR